MSNMSTNHNERAQREFSAMRGMTTEQAARAVELSFDPSSVHVDAPLSNFAVMIRNRETIADFVCPRVKVNKASDKFFKYGSGTMFEVANAALTGNESVPGRVRYTISTDNYSAVDYGLMDFVSYKEIANADAPIEPRMHATKVVVNHLDLLKELRVASLMFTSGNYGSNTSALSGANRWDLSTSNPAKNIDDAIEACEMRPNVMVMGAQVWTAVRSHPRFQDLVLSRSGTADGAVPTRITPDFVARAFDLDAVYIGRAKYHSNTEGQTATSAYIWGKSVALVRTMDAPSMRETGCFAKQFVFQERQTQIIDAPLPGLSGGEYIKVTESVDEKIIAGSAAGYLYTTVVS